MVHKGKSRFVVVHVVHLSAFICLPIHRAICKYWMIIPVYGLCFGPCYKVSQMLQWENVPCVHNDNQLLEISVWGFLKKLNLGA